MRASKIAPILSALVFCGAATAPAQNILRQYSIPYRQGFNQPYFIEEKFIAPDGAGQLYLFNESAASLHKTDSNGKELWHRQTGFEIGKTFVTGMAVTALGTYLGGTTGGVLAGQRVIGGNDAFLRKYDLNGAELWTRQFGTADNDFVMSIAAEPSGGVYVLGGATPAPGGAPATYFIRRFDAGGAEVWTRSFPRSNPTDIFGAVADASGVYFWGYNVVRRFDRDGNDLWTRHIGDMSYILLDAAADNAGIYVLYFNGPDYFVGRYDLTGTELWTQRKAGSSYVSGVIAADNTGFYVAGATGAALPGQCYAGGGDVFLSRFDTSAAPVWTREFGTAGFERPAGIAIGPAGIDVTGFTAADSAFLARLEKVSVQSTGSRPRISWECVLNAASYLGGGVAPGEIVTILGANLGPSTLARIQVTPDGRIATALAGARILFNGEAAPMVYASDTQSSAIVPYSVAGKSTVDVQIEYNGALSDAVTVPVLESRPGIFSVGAAGSGQAAVLNQDGTVNSPKNPAAPGSIVSIYGTGAGLPQPAGATDQVTGDAPTHFKTPAWVRLESDGSCGVPYLGTEAEYFGGAPRSVPGLFQLNVQLPLDIPPGDAVPLYFGFSAVPGIGTIEQQVTIAVQ